MALDGSPPLEIQALFFSVEQWTRAQAEDWCDEHDHEPVAWRARTDDHGRDTHHIAVMFEPDAADPLSFVTMADDYPEGVTASMAKRKTMAGAPGGRTRAVAEVEIRAGEQSEEDPFEFVLSDDSVDRMGDVIEASGWRLAEFRRNPICLFAHDHKAVLGTWEKVRVEGNRLLGRLKLAAPGTSQLIDEVRSLLEQRVLRAVSVGFRPIKYEAITDKDGEWTGIRFLVQSLHEVSVVAVPANANALAVARSLDISPATRRLIFSRDADRAVTGQEDRKPAPTRGKSADRSKSISTRTKTMDPEDDTEDKPTTLVSQIKAKERALTRAEVELEQIEADILEADGEVTDEQEKRIDKLNESVAELTKALGRLRKLEQNKATGNARTIERERDQPALIRGAARPDGRKKGDLFIRWVAANFLATGKGIRLEEAAEKLFGPGSGAEKGMLSPGDTTQSSDTKTQVYSELLIGTAIAGNAVRVTNNTREPFTVGATASFPSPGVYEIQIRRTVVPSGSDVIADAAVVTLLRSYLDGDVLNLQHRASLVELQVLATDQLSGSVPPLNGIVTSRLRRFTNAGFSGEKAESSNPAEIAVDMLMGGLDGKQTKFPLKAAQIEFADFVRLRAICNEKRTQTVNGETWTGPRYEWNGVIETNMTLGEAVNSVLSVARAQLRFTASGKVGVIIDQEQSTPRALITPANSWDFRGQRPFAQQPHAIRVNFNDETRDWQPASVAVYNTGYSEETATIFEDLDSWGITSFPEAWRYGRYMLAQAILRSEVFSVAQDAENLVVQRGDLVTVQHDVPLHGGMTARVTQVDGNRIGIDRQFAGAPTGYTVRSNRGAITSGAVLSIQGTDEFTVAAGHSIKTGDLITLGQLNTVTQDYLVRSIEPGEDFTARLSLVKYDPGVYSDEEGPLPPWDPGFGDDLISGTNIRVTNLLAGQSWAYLDRRPVKVVDLAWKIGGAAATYFSAIIEWRPGTTDWIAIGNVTGGARSFAHRIPWDERALWDERVSYRVRPFNGLGGEGQAATLAVQLTDYTARPLPPRNCFLDVRGQDLTLTWQASLSADVVNYLIRYSPSTADDVTWLGATQVASVAWDQDQATFKARTGTYIIRAVNAIGRLSDAVFLRTTIETLPDINVIDTIDEAPLGWPGSVYRFTKGTDLVVEYADIRTLANTIVPVALYPISYDVATLAGGTVNVATDDVLAEDYLISEPTWDPETTQDQAVYTCAETLDLGAIYEHFLQAKHVAFAVRDHDFPALARNLRSKPLGASLELLDNDEHVPWQAWAEYRSAVQQDPIRVWGPINDHGPLATAGVQFGPWRKFLATKATARYLQFRFVAESEIDGIRIVITDGLIEIDMPDRTWRRVNIPIQAGGSVVNFDPAFAAPPILAVTIEGATTATSYKAIALSRTAAEIALYNNAGTSVAGQIDLAALGYGKERDNPI